MEITNTNTKTNRLIQNEIARACKDNPKHFWKYVKSKTKSKETIGDLIYTKLQTILAIKLQLPQTTTKLKFYVISF